MPLAFQCRLCKGPPIPFEPDNGLCPNCLRFGRHNRVFVNSGDGEDSVEDAAAIVTEGVPVSAGDLMRAFAEEEAGAKIETGMPGVDWIFDGGLPAFGGGAILLAADAGAGKSTLLMTLFRLLALMKYNSLYVSAEQDLKDMRRQFARIGKFPSSHMLLHHACDQDDIVKAIEETKADVYAIDSLNTVENVTDIDGNSFANGSVPANIQLGKTFRKLAKEREAIIFCVGHVTNDGTIAGGSTVRHNLDATLVMRYWPGLTQQQKDSDPRRILAFEGKTRFGPRGRRALLEMTETGLEDKGPLIDENAEEKTI